MNLAATGASAAAAAVALLAITASAGWIDPDTPEKMKTTSSLVDNTEYGLVSSHHPFYLYLDEIRDAFSYFLSLRPNYIVI